MTRSASPKYKHPSLFREWVDNESSWQKVANTKESYFKKLAPLVKLTASTLGTYYVGIPSHQSQLKLVEKCRALKAEEKKIPNDFRYWVDNTFPTALYFRSKKALFRALAQSFGCHYKTIENNYYNTTNQTNNILKAAARWAEKFLLTATPLPPEPPSAHLRTPKPQAQKTKISDFLSPTPSQENATHQHPSPNHQAKKATPPISQPASAAPSAAAPHHPLPPANEPRRIIYLSQPSPQPDPTPSPRLKDWIIDIFRVAKSCPLFRRR
jgi:hypothetical protein